MTEDVMAYPATHNPCVTSRIVDGDEAHELLNKAFGDRAAKFLETANALARHWGFALGAQWRVVDLSNAGLYLVTSPVDESAERPPTPEYHRQYRLGRDALGLLLSRGTLLWLMELDESNDEHYYDMIQKIDDFVPHHPESEGLRNAID